MSFFSEHIFATLTAFKYDTIIDKNLKTLKSLNIQFQNSIESESTNQFLPTEIDYKKAGDKLKEFIKDELDRKKIIEEKARALLLVISASIAITTGSLSYIGLLEITIGFVLISLAFLIIGFIFMIFAVLSIIRAINIREYNYVLVEDFFSQDAQNNVTFSEDEKQLTEILYRNIKCNELINTKRSNHTYAALTNLRNGILLIACFFLSVVFSKVFTKPIINEAPEETSQLIIPPNTPLQIEIKKESISEIECAETVTLQRKDTLIIKK